MAATIAFDAGQVQQAATALHAAPARLEATLAGPALAGALDVLEQAVAGAWSGPYAVALSAGTRVQAPDQVVVGGGAGHLSGGATAGDLVYGVEYGGGRRVGAVRAGRRAKAHTRRTTAQFPARTLAATHAVDAAADRALDQVGDHVEQAIHG